MNDFNTLGVMIDCSRNAVMKASEVKKFALNLSKMGYNALLLYTEDTYEIEDEPFFGHLRGRFIIGRQTPGGKGRSLPESLKYPLRPDYTIIKGIIQLIKRALFLQAFALF